MRVRGPGSRQHRRVQGPGFVPTAFFERCVVEVARDMVGMELVWGECAGVIVETEAYAATDDAACHTATRPSTRQFMDRMPAGTAYVYLNYGMHWLFNVLVKGGGNDGLVLVRALEPTAGVETMRSRRGRDELALLCSGPGRLGQALGLTARDHGAPLAGSAGENNRGLRWRAEEAGAVVEDVRVGIRQAMEKRWRFLLKDSPFVSVAAGRVKPPGGNWRMIK